MTSSVKRIVVAGSGPAAWISASGLARSLRHLEPDITVLDDVPATEPPRALWTLPSQRGAHAQIGVKEVEFLRATGASFRLGSEFGGWQGDGSRFVHAHGEIGSPIEATPFYKYLQARAITGQAEKPEAYSVAGLAARAGRFARPMGAEGELTADFTYGYHVDERPYAGFLRELALRAGIKHVQRPVVDLQRHESGDIVAVVLEGGATLAGDLFVDCTGCDARLLSRLDAAPRTDWSRWLPCDRSVTGYTKGLTDPPSATRIVATEAGWLFQVPLAQSTFVGHVYASAFMGDDAAAAALQRACGPLTSSTLSRWTSGRRERFWVNNCVALGAGAADLEPLAGAELHFAQLGLAYLLELFPLDAASAVEAAEYNRVMGEYAEALRDFTLAHYRVSRRSGAFWDAVRAVAPPATLAAKLDLYCAGGRIDMRDHDPFEELDWAWLLLGGGLVPAALESQVRRALGVLHHEQAVELRSVIERLAGGMPRHVDYLVRAKAAAPRVEAP
jgi:tryptophan halogenase